MNEDRGPDPGGRAREEAAAMLVLIVGGVLLQLAQRYASDPDAFRQVKMRAAKRLERFAATSARNWWRVAERARLAYEAERPL
jgi:hypothetical protein